MSARNADYLLFLSFLFFVKRRYYRLYFSSTYKIIVKPAREVSSATGDTPLLLRTPGERREYFVLRSANIVYIFLVLGICGVGEADYFIYFVIIGYFSATPVFAWVIRHEFVASNNPVLHYSCVTFGVITISFSVHPSVGTRQNVDTIIHCQYLASSPVYWPGRQTVQIDTIFIPRNMFTWAH